jgi:hypothetical protein
MTLWNVNAGGVRLTDELSRPRTPCGVRPRDRDTGGAADSRERLDPSVHACHDNGAQPGYGLMNQPCQRFTGGPQSSPAPRLATAPGLRILDVAIWIRHSHSRAASRIRRDSGIPEPGHNRP